MSECAVKVSFARRWEAETAVQDMHGLEFEGNRLEITLLRPSGRAPPPHQTHSKTVEGLDKLLADIDGGRL